MSLRMLMVPVAILAMTTSGQAQEAASSAAKPSVERYLCTFAGKCGGVADQPVVTRNAPDTKGFRLARPVAATDGAHATARRGSAQAAPHQRRASTARRAGYAAAPAAPPVAVDYATARRPRADLMIGFELNSAQLSAEGTRAAQVFARSLLMPELKDKRFLIEGHTDQRGGARVNTPLSAARARAVADYLIVLGVAGNRLQTRGYGASAPLPGRAKSDPANRRVEAELIS
jgi:outer membrane protein OmpA-like peptidoglycan-associated protein